MMTLGGLYGIIVIAAIVLAFLMPFFIFKIRNQVIEINDKMTKIVSLLEAQLSDENIPLSVDGNGKEIKICPKCGRKNRADVWNCQYCDTALLPKGFKN
jgi:hypothetical protein